MFQVSKLKGHNFMAISIPPVAHQDLSDGFKELSRIHFYLGYKPVDFMFEAVKNASLEEVEKGKVQILFAVKEIQEFLSGSYASLEIKAERKFEPAVYFNKTFKEILEHTKDVLDDAYKKPTKKKNVEAVETMAGLTQEVVFLHEELQKAGVTVAEIDSEVKEIKEKFKRIYSLGGNYHDLKSLKQFDDYKNAAIASVLEQLKQPYDFNYTELSKIYMDHDGSWASTLTRIRQEQRLLSENDPTYKFNTQESAELKERFLKQANSFNRILHNGVVNYALSFAALISKEAYFYGEKSQISPEAHYDNDLRMLKSFKKNGLAYSIEIEDFEANKDEYLKQKANDKLFFEDVLVVLHRQESNINQSLSKVRSNLFNTKLKETVTFEGDIGTGFVVGTFSNSDRVMLIHKDKFVNRPEAVYAMILPKEKYDNLVKNDKLVFTDKLRDSEAENASNFFNYGQFLQEVSNGEVQEFFLGQEFDLVDETVRQEMQMKKMKL